MNKDEYYYVEGTNRCPHANYIIKKNKHYISPNNSLLNKRSFESYNEIPVIKREATTEEIQWLNECIRQNKFVPKNKVKFNIELEYEIC